MENVFILFDGNKVVDMVILDKWDSEEIGGRFLESYKDHGANNEWLHYSITTLNLEGQRSDVGIDLIYLVTMNNTPVRAFVNLTTEEVKDLYEDCIKKTDDYRRYEVKRIMY